MRVPLLHGFEGGFGNGGMRAKIRVANLQADNFMSTGFEGKDTVCHGDRGRLADEVELCVEVLHGVSVSKKQKSRQQMDGTLFLTSVGATLLYKTGKFALAGRVAPASPQRHKGTKTPRGILCDFVSLRLGGYFLEHCFIKRYRFRIFS